MWKERVYRGAVLVLLVLPMVMAGRYWFVCDDAYIAFRFVRNLVDGYGLVFNPGERVEGYTSFLWVVQLAAIWKGLGVRPEDAAPVMSLVWTLVTGAGVVALASTSPAPRRRAVVLTALLWWATNRSVWVWSTSGLEERQFTGLLTWAVVALATAGTRAAVGGSLLVGLAALTRPEAYLIGPIMLLWAAAGAWRAGELSIRRLAAVFGPAGALVVTHVLWRRWFYGEWLPNTYYAKNVRDWWSAGLQYLGYAAIEHALWVILPLALIGTLARWRARDTTPMVMWAWAVPSFVHLAKIGGDHFEFRMFDELWPPLYVAAADGLAFALGASPWAFAVAAVLVDGWGLAIPLAHDQLAFARAGRSETVKMQVQPTPERVPWLSYALPVPWLLGPYNRMEAAIVSHSVAIRHREHQVFANIMRGQYAAYQRVEHRDFFQPDAVAGESSIGIYGYYLPGMTLIDLRGLCDWTIARNPVTVDDAHRQLAHDREPPRGYLAQRGVNIEMEAMHESAARALNDGTFAIEVQPGLFASFLAEDPAYAERAFPKYKLLDRTALANPWQKGAPAGEPVADRFTADGSGWVVDRWIGRFDDGVDGWALTGRAFARQPALGTWMGQPKVSAFEGTGLLNSYHPSWAAWAVGVATSPPFTARPGEALSFRLGGTGAALVLLADGREVQRWEASGGGVMRRIVRPLDDVAGRGLALELRDQAEQAWITLDAVSVVRAALAAP